LRYFGALHQQSTPIAAHLLTGEQRPGLRQTLGALAVRGSIPTVAVQQAPIPQTYVFELGTEPMLDMPAAAAAWERLFGNRPHKNGLRRLYTRPNRHGLVLPTLLAGGRRMTSEAAIRWYVESSTAAASRRPCASQNVATVAMTPSEREALVRAGVLDSQEV